MINYILLLIFTIQLLPFISSSTFQKEQKNKCLKRTDCFSCSKISHCQWKQGQCEYSPLQKQWVHWYDKIRSCKYHDSLFKNNTEKYCLNIKSNKVPFYAAIAKKESFNNITDIFCDWSVTSLSPFKEYKFIFYLQNMTNLYKSNFVLVLNYPNGFKEKRLFNNYFNKTIGIIGFSLYFHSNEISIDHLNSFTFKVQEVEFLPLILYLIILICFCLIFFGCIGYVTYKNRQIRIEKKEQELQFIRDQLKRMRQLLHPIQYNKKEHGSDHTVCSICLEDFNTGSVVCNLKCYHVFHYDCIRKWVETVYDNPKCPNCNKCLIDNSRINESLMLIINSSISN